MASHVRTFVTLKCGSGERRLFANAGPLTPATPILRILILKPCYFILEDILLTRHGLLSILPLKPDLMGPHLETLIPHVGKISLPHHSLLPNSIPSVIIRTSVGIISLGFFSLVYPRLLFCSRFYI